ncbi:MAG: hypothetical protein AAF628_01020 [Planctomycetota bacterium]
MCAALLPALAAHVLLTFTIDGDGPVRFGVPLPADALQQGLRIADPAVHLQWRILQPNPDPRTGRQWVELAITGGRGRLRLRAGGVGAIAADQGSVVRLEETTTEDDATRVVRRVHRWRTGEVDRCERVRFRQRGWIAAESFGAGEALTTSAAPTDGRWLRVHMDDATWMRAEVLPRTGSLGRDLRGRLAELVPALPQLPGLRGRGDYGRSKGVVTNLEFDTTLGFARLGLALQRRDLLQRALDSARHLVDRDLDRETGMPFCHGPDHRAYLPEPGHVWLTGTLLVGCLAADDALIRAARGMALGLARHPPRGQGRDERARDYAWPLLEMEQWLRFEPHPVVEQAANALGLDLLRRFDREAKVLRFGEGEQQDAVYFERAWLTGGCCLPALRAFARRTGSRRAHHAIEVMERRLLALVSTGGAGVPTHYWVRRGLVRNQARKQGGPAVFFYLEGLAPAALPRVLQRRNVRRALRDLPCAEDEDLATTWSIAARTTWIYR